MNDLNGKAWAKLSKSVWINQKLLFLLADLPLSVETFCLVKHAKRKEAMAYRPLDENRVKLIELFTKKHQVVLDPFLAQGDTMEAALFVHRQFVGIGKTDEECEHAKIRAREQVNNNKVQLWVENKDVMRIASSSVDFFLTELPPFDFIQEDYEAHLKTLQAEFEQYNTLLRKHAYIALIVSDRRYHTRYYPYHADIAKKLEEIGWVQQGLITLIHDTNPIKSYGYPTTFVPNIVNQFIVILRKY